MAARLELTLSEAFAKHKRNLMVICSIIVVMAIATPTSLNVPGLGTDLSIPVPVAFGLLGIALIYMFATYAVEMRTLVHRHSKAILDEGKATLDEKIAQKQQQLASDFFGAEYQIRSFSNALSETEHVARQVVGPQEVNKEKILSEKTVRLEGVLQECKVKVDALKVTCENLDRNFARLSSDISRTQRAGFRVLEQAIPITFAAVALLVSIDGAFNRSRCVNLIVEQLTKPAPSTDLK